MVLDIVLAGFWDSPIGVQFIMACVCVVVQGLDLNMLVVVGIVSKTQKEKDSRALRSPVLLETEADQQVQWLQGI